MITGTGKIHLNKKRTANLIRHFYYLFFYHTLLFYQIVDFENKGRGVVAAKTFYRGDFVVEYAGDLISIAEAKAREDEYAKDPTKGCYMYYFNFHNKKYW